MKTLKTFVPIKSKNSASKLVMVYTHRKPNMATASLPTEVMVSGHALPSGSDGSAQGMVMA